VTGSVAISPRGMRRIHAGHPWIFAADLTQVEASNGDLVQVLDSRGREVGCGFYSAHSKIGLRMVSGARPAANLEAFFRSRLERAIARRQPLQEVTDAMRLVAAEGDDLPGLIVDAYADVLVLSALVPAIERRLDCIVPYLVETLAPRMVLARNDGSVRRLEGLPQEQRILHGVRVEQVTVREGLMRYQVQPFTGQKTGMYLDQRGARLRLHGWLRPGARMLDLCSHHGGFALQARAAGAAEVVAVDSSQPAVAAIQEHARLNQLDGIATICGNVFDETRALYAAGHRFDLVVLDPPAFAKNRREISGALRGYLDLNRRAIELMVPGGVLITCSCSYHIGLDRFVEIVRQAAARCRRRAFVRERLLPELDHPVTLGLPESDYLKVLRVEFAGEP
jgi:23S rRNA (cytosine1962-C5)-methyltransferase